MRMDVSGLSHEGFLMLGRLVRKGSFRIFHDVLADELIGRGYAELKDDALYPTQQGRDQHRALSAAPL